MIGLFSCDCRWMLLCPLAHPFLSFWSVFLLCWVTIKTYSATTHLWIMSPWSLEGVSLLLWAAPLELYRNKEVVWRGRAPAEWEYLNSMQPAWDLIISPPVISPSEPPQAGLWWTGTFPEDSLAWKRKENHQKRSSSSIIFSLRWDCWNLELKAKLTWLINDAYLRCTSLNLHLVSHFESGTLLSLSRW